MGMTIDDAIAEVEQQKLDYQEFWEEYKNEHIEALDMAMDTMRKYQKLQADYENRLKADMVAMLTEIQLEILELKSYESADGQDLVMLADIGILFQQKINSLKEDKDAI